MPLIREFRADFRRGRTGKGLRVRSDTEVYQLSIRDADNMMVLPNGSLRRRWGTYIRTPLTAQTRLVEWIGAGVKHNFLLYFQPGEARFEKLKTVAEANAGDFADTAEVVAGPWTAANLWFMQITPTRDGFIVTDNAFAPRIYSYDADKALGSRWSVKVMTQRSIEGGRRKQLPFVTFDSDAVFHPRIFLTAESPDAYQNHLATAMGWTRGAYPLDFLASLGTGKCTVDRDYFKASHVGTHFRWGDGEFKVLQVTDARTAEIKVVRDLAVKLDTNPFFLRKDSKIVEVAFPNHGLEAGETCFFYGMEDTGEAELLLTRIPQVPRTSSSTSAVRTGPASKYTVKKVVDENHFEIEGGGALPTTTGLFGGQDIHAIADKGKATVREAIMGPARGYPQAACIHENRLWLGGFPEWPDVAIGSVPFDYDNFDTGTGASADAVLLMGVGNKSQIRHMVSFSDLLLFHDKGVHYVASPQDAGVSQETARARPAAEFGSSYTPPVMLDGGVFYVERDGLHIREYMKPQGEEIMTSPPTTIVVTDWVKKPFEAQPYIGGGDESMAYAFFVQTDGSLLVMHSSRNDQSFGFMRWSLSHAGDSFESVSAVGDRLFAVVNCEGSRFVVEFDTWSTDPIGMDVVELLSGGAKRAWNSARHRGRKSIQVTVGAAPGRYHKRFDAKALPASGDFRIDAAEAEVRVGRKMEFSCDMHPVVVNHTQGNMAGAKTRLVGMSVHWEKTTVGQVHGWAVAENLDELDTEFDRPMQTDGWREYPIGEWGEEAFARIEGDTPGRLGIRAVNMKVYL